MKLYYYENQGVGVEIHDHKGKELYHRINIEEDEEPSRAETYTVYPFRYANKRNAETIPPQIGESILTILILC